MFPSFSNETARCIIIMYSIRGDFIKIFDWLLIVIIWIDDVSPAERIIDWPSPRSRHVDSSICVPVNLEESLERYNHIFFLRLSSLTGEINIYIRMTWPCPEWCIDSDGSLDIRRIINISSSQRETEKKKKIRYRLETLWGNFSIVLFRVCRFSFFFLFLLPLSVSGGEIPWRSPC